MALHRTNTDTGARLIRRFTALMMVLLAVFLVSLWLLAPPERLNALFAHTDCRKIEIQASDGSAVVGIEDLAHLSSIGGLVLSAHDRRDTGRSGGLYRIPLFSLLGRGPVGARTLSPQPESDAIYKPHGISLSPDESRLAVVVRGNPGEAWIEVGALEQNEWIVDKRIRGQSLCRANDLQMTSNATDEMWITLDRADCEPTARDIVPGATTGRLGRYNGEDFAIERVGLSFPNGLVMPYIAETRANRILRPGEEPIQLPGSPDNLNMTADGQLVAAVHPKLLHLWLYNEGWQERAPSRILRINPEDASLEVLFDDPDGFVFSAATSALLVDDILIAGSVNDAGLLVCKAGR